MSTKCFSTLVATEGDAAKWDELCHIPTNPGAGTRVTGLRSGILGGMITKLRAAVAQWTVVVPVVSFLVLVLTWHKELPGWVVAVVACFLVGAVLSAVHHAEVIAHWSGSRSGRWSSRWRSP